MIAFGKTSGVAVAAMSYLAEHRGGPPVTSAEVGRARGYSAAHVAKVLSRLSSAGLVDGARGPRGGYRLARPAGAISLAEVIEPFEGSRQNIVCPFGPNWCGVREPCPLHDQMVTLHENNRRALEKMTLDVFCHEAAV